MDTEKAWEEFQANDSSIRKSESVQQDIQQILDTVTQIKTDVDQLKAEGPKATGPVDEEPSLSAPEEQQPSPEMPPAPESEAEPQAPMGDLMAQPEDGAATPVPEEPAPVEPPAEPAPATFDVPSPFSDEGTDDVDRLLDMATEMKDPELKQQIIALAYQAIEAQKAPPMPPMPPAEPAPEEILAAAMDANGDGMLSEEEIEPMMRSADTETVECDANAAEAIKDKPSETVTMSDDEKDEEDKKEESDEKKDDDKKEEPGVNDELPEAKEEDKDSLEDLPEVTEVKIETEEQTPEETEEEKGEAIESIIDSILEDAKERIKEQVIEATEGIDAEHGPFMMSTAEMMKSFRGGKRTAVKESEPIRKSIDWPEDVKSLGMEDKCRFFAKSFSQMDEKMQDNVVTLMDTALGSDATSSIFKSEGVDLDKFYEPVVKAAVSESNLDNQPTSDGISVTGDKKDNSASDATEGVATTPKQASCDDTETVQDSVTPEQETESLEACKKSADVPEGVGIHIPTVSEMMAFKKSGTSFYTSISREAAEPHGMVAMGPDNEIPSVKDMFAKRFGQ